MTADSCGHFYAISEAFKILQSGIIDRENKSELKKLREAMERIENNSTNYVDIWFSIYKE